MNLNAFHWFAKVKGKKSHMAFFLKVGYMRVFSNSLLCNQPPTANLLKQVCPPKLTGCVRIALITGYAQAAQNRSGDFFAKSHLEQTANTWNKV